MKNRTESVCFSVLSLYAKIYFTFFTGTHISL